jgi:hypothetical protein
MTDRWNFFVGRCARRGECDYPERRPSYEHSRYRQHGIRHYERDHEQHFGAVAQCRRPRLKSLLSGKMGRLFPMAGGGSCCNEASGRTTHNTIGEPRVITEQWRKHYSTVRPHSSLGYRPPAPETHIFRQVANARRKKKRTQHLHQLRGLVTSSWSTNFSASRPLSSPRFVSHCRQIVSTLCTSMLSM